MQNRIFFVCECGILRGADTFRGNSWKKLPSFVPTKFPVKKTLWWWWSQTPNQIFVNTKNGAKISSISRQKLPRAFSWWSRGLSAPTLQVNLITQLLVYIYFLKHWRCEIIGILYLFKTGYFLNILNTESCL